MPPSFSLLLSSPPPSPLHLPLSLRSSAFFFVWKRDSFSIPLISWKRCVAHHDHYHAFHTMRRSIAAIRPPLAGSSFRSIPAAATLATSLLSSSAHSCWPAYTSSRRWVSSAGSGVAEGGFIGRFRNLCREFQLYQDRKWDDEAAKASASKHSSFLSNVAGMTSQATEPFTHFSSGVGGTTLQRHSRALPSASSTSCPRSVLFVPASKPRALAKLDTIPADCFIVDLEDSVGISMKRRAREQVQEFIESLRSANEEPGAKAAMNGGSGSSAPPSRGRQPTQRRPQIILRINSPDFDMETAILDLNLVGLLGMEIDGVAVPKVTMQTYKLIEDYLHPNHQLWAFFESPQSILQAPAICAQGVYHYAVMGYNDLGMELQLPLMSITNSKGSGRSVESEETNTNRADNDERHSLYMAAHLPLWQSTVQVLMAARAANMYVIDGVFNDPTDTPGLRRNLRESVALGLDGKTLIHPSQVEPTNAAFTPSDEEVCWATRIVEAICQAQGGVAIVDGKMVEDLHRRQAERVLARRQSEEMSMEKRNQESNDSTESLRTQERNRGGEDKSLGRAVRMSESAEHVPRRRTPSRHRSLPPS